MNILFQCSEYPPFKNGGIGTVTKIIAEALARGGHKVSVCGYYSEQPEKEYEEEVNGVTVYRFNLGLRKGNFRRILFLLLNKLGLAGRFIQRELSWYEEKIAELVRKRNIELLEMTDFYNFNLFRAKLHYKKFDVPTVMRAHGSASFIQHYSGKDQVWVVENDRRHFSRMDYLCPVSKFAEEYVTHVFPDVVFKGTSVVYNPIENSFLKYNAPSESKSILFIGKLSETKGAYALAAAFEKVATDFPEWQLVYAGKGDPAPILKLLSPAVQKRVVFLGFCSRPRIAEAIDQCAFACIPTYFENFSMVPLEIMGRTRAVIFTHLTSGNEIIDDGVDGFTVNPEDIDGISQKMKLLIVDRALRDGMAQKAFLKIKNGFTTDVVVRELLDFYCKIKQTKG